MAKEVDQSPGAGTDVPGIDPTAAAVPTIPGGAQEEEEEGPNPRVNLPTLPRLQKVNPNIRRRKLMLFCWLLCRWTVEVEVKVNMTPFLY